MNNLHVLLENLDAATARGERCALATIVAVEGSSYRRPGARMLVTEQGACTGGISPGCLEADVVAHARRVIATSVPALLEYETSTTGTELPWGLGLGCGGTIHILIEPLAPGSSIVDALRLAEDERRNAHGLRLTTTYGSDWASHEAALLPADESSLPARSHAMPGVLVETLLPRVPLVIFGAGPDAVPLVELARTLGWHVEVVDPQARPSSRHRFAAAHRVTLARPDDMGHHLAVTPRTLALVMTHDYTHDVALLGFLLASPAQYIGVMGPARRTRRMLQDLSGDVETAFARLHAPAGLDIGADGPEEVALSVIAEMRAVLDQRSGGMLRDRAAGIHGNHADACSAAELAR